MLEKSLFSLIAAADLEPCWFWPNAMRLRSTSFEGIWTVDVQWVHEKFHQLSKLQEPMPLIDAASLMSNSNCCYYSSSITVTIRVRRLVWVQRFFRDLKKSYIRLDLAIVRCCWFSYFVNLFFPFKLFFCLCVHASACECWVCIWWTYDY